MTIKRAKDLSADELAERYGQAMENSIQRNEMDGEFKRRELFWIRCTAIVAIISLVIVGATSIGSFVLELCRLKS